MLNYFDHPECRVEFNGSGLKSVRVDFAILLST